MLRNYLVIAWKVFLRRKFFTFINLFGISLTLAVIMVAVTISESYLNPVGPEKTHENYLFINHLTLNDKTKSLSGKPGYKFITKYIQSLKTPELISINNGVDWIAMYHNNRKFNNSIRKTDANFWKILDFSFISGREYSEEEFKLGNFVAVINEQTQKELFSGQSAIGKTITIEAQNFEVIGVVKNVSALEKNSKSDIWLPYTTMPSSSYQNSFLDGWEVFLYHSNSKMLKSIQTEYYNLINAFENSGSRGITSMFSLALTKIEHLSWYYLSEKNNYNTGIEKLIVGSILATILFMLLPCINMINLNVSRIMERSYEIGVRKAFGASMNQLLGQFIVENLAITLLGGVLGMILSLFILNTIESIGLIPNVAFVFNLKVFFVGLIMILIFGLMSGAYPAYKMSRISPAMALKGVA